MRSYDRGFLEVYRLLMEDSGYNWGDQFWKWSEVKIITPITVDNSKNIKWENYIKPRWSFLKFVYNNGTVETKIYSMTECLSSSKISPSLNKSTASSAIKEQSI